MPESALPWHQPAWERVTGQFQSDRMPHALLLTGLPGVGKLQFASRLASWLLCKQPGPDGACGSCRSCQQVAAATHPDFHTVTVPEGKTQIGVEQIREQLVEALQLSARYGAWKIAMVHPADRMNRNSFNALLKTLEEPSGMSLLILVSARPARLAATIRSRCQHLPLPLPDAGTARQWLGQQGLKDSETLLALAGGAPLAALMLNEAEWVSDREELCRQLLALVAGGEDPVRVAQSWAKLPFAQGIDWLNTLVQDMIRLRQLGPEASLLNADLRRDLQSSAHRLDWRSLHRHRDDLIRLRALSDAPLTAQLQWEALMFAWSERLEAAPLH